MNRFVDRLIQRQLAFQHAIKKGTLRTNQLGDRYAWPVVGKDSLGLAHFGAVNPATGIDDTNKVITFTISVYAEDRDGDVVRPMGCQLKHYARNPVVFFGHQEYEIPIGVCRNPQGGLDVFLSEERIQSKWWVDQPDADAMFIYGKVARGILNAASIAFVPLKAYRRSAHFKAQTHNDQDGGPEDGWFFDTYDLTEWSIVGVPANAGAIRDAIDTEKSFISPKLKKSLTPYAAVAKGCWNGWCYLPCDSMKKPAKKKDCGCNDCKTGKKCPCEDKPKKGFADSEGLRLNKVSGRWVVDNRETGERSDSFATEEEAENYRTQWHNELVAQRRARMKPHQNQGPTLGTDFFVASASGGTKKELPYGHQQSQADMAVGESGQLYPTPEDKCACGGVMKEVVGESVTVCRDCGRAMVKADVAKPEHMVEKPGGTPTSHDYHSDKMNRCVSDLLDQGKNEESAHRICYSSIGESANKDLNGTSGTAGGYTVPQEDVMNKSKKTKKNSVRKGGPMSAERLRVRPAQDYGIGDWEGDGWYLVDEDGIVSGPYHSQQEAENHYPESEKARKTMKTKASKKKAEEKPDDAETEAVESAGPKHSAQVLANLHAHQRSALDYIDNETAKMDHKDIAEELQGHKEDLNGHLEKYKDLMEEHHPDQDIGKLSDDIVKGVPPSGEEAAVDQGEVPEEPAEKPAEEVSGEKVAADGEEKPVDEAPVEEKDEEAGKGDVDASTEEILQRYQQPKSLVEAKRFIKELSARIRKVVDASTVYHMASGASLPYGAVASGGRVSIRRKTSAETWQIVVEDGNKTIVYANADSPEEAIGKAREAMNWKSNRRSVTKAGSCMKGASTNHFETIRDAGQHMHDLANNAQDIPSHHKAGLLYHSKALGEICRELGNDMGDQEEDKELQPGADEMVNVEDVPAGDQPPANEDTSAKQPPPDADEEPTEEVKAEDEEDKPKDEEISKAVLDRWNSIETALKRMGCKLS